MAIQNLSAGSSEVVFFQNSVGSIQNGTIVLNHNEKKIVINDVKRVVIIKESNVVSEIIGFSLLALVLYFVLQVLITLVVVLLFFLLVFAFAWIILFYNKKRYWLAFSFNHGARSFSVPVKKSLVREAADLIYHVYEYKIHMTRM